MKIAIIGGGLAGCAAAYVLRQYGADIDLYESSDQLANGASGQDIGMYNPRLAAELTPHSSYYAGAYCLAYRTFKSLENIDHKPCGTLHLIPNEQKRIRCQKMIKNWGWSKDNMQYLTPDQASVIADIDITYEALYCPDAGTVSPKKLCLVYTKDIKVHLRYTVTDITELDADIIILANGWAAQDLVECNLPLQAMRGQVTYVKSTQVSQRLKCNLSFGGYLTPCDNQIHALGASFDRHATHDQTKPEDDVYNLEKLYNIIPSLDRIETIVDHKAGVRVATPDYFPIVSNLQDNIYGSLAHGSHGIISSLMAGYVLAAQIFKTPLPIKKESFQKLSFGRF